MRRFKTRKGPPPHKNVALIQKHVEEGQQHEAARMKRHEPSFELDRELDEGLKAELSATKELPGPSEAEEPRS